VLEPGADDRCILRRPDHCVVNRNAMRSEGAQISERLDEIGFSLSIAADEKVRASDKV
jgi:hypothetical protein